MLVFEAREVFLTRDRVKEIPREQEYPVREENVDFVGVRDHGFSIS